MPFSNRSPQDASKVQNLPTLQERYALRRCLSETALGKLYWAQDLKRMQSNGEQANVLVFTLLPALAQDPLFEQVLGHVLPTYQKLAPGMPQVSDDGKTDDGTRWMVMPNIGGMLLSERLAELDSRGIPMADAVELLDNLSTAVSNQRPEGVFGYLEPGAVLLGSTLPCLLTAPVVAALRMAYSSNPAERPRQTLHSGYISPEVLLGDMPTSEDDTFSIACIAYHLLQGERPFGKQSTLESAVRNLSPASCRKLRPDAWHALQQGLSLKRASRQKNPATLLRTLQRKQQKKLLLPIASLVAASVVAFTTYHLLSSRDTAPVPEQAVPEQAAPQLSGIAPIQTPMGAENAATLVGETSLSALQDNAADAIRKGDDSAVDYLRKAIALEPENTKTQKLLAQMINDQHSEAEALLSAGNLDEASKLLSTADGLITEFTLTDSLKRQVSLETQTEQAKRKQALAQDAATTAAATTTATATNAVTNTASNTTSSDANADTTQYLERAQRAISYGNLSNGDDRSESAVSYLSSLLEKTPDHPEAMKLLEKVVTLQQDNAISLLRKRDTDKARTSLDESQSLIGKYRLDDLVEEQIALEKRYRETLAMGVFTPGKEETAPVASKPAAEKPATAPAAAITATPLEIPQEAPQETENPEAAEAPVASAPVEVRVPPEIPVQEAIMPPIQLDTPPAPAPDPNRKTFTPDVPNLMELPLDVFAPGNH